VAARVDAWFELHRWEPPVIGKADQQVPWFSPEYCMWMAQLKCPVWMREAIPDIPTSQRLPWEGLTKKYGHFFFTSSISWMAAMAIELILAERSKGNTEEALIGFWGVDMAANEELYSGQRAGCQFFITLAASMGIKVYVPPESDLMAPMPLYGIEEGSHRTIRFTARKAELMMRKQNAEVTAAKAQAEVHYLNGAIEDMDYHMRMWLHEGEVLGTNFEGIFGDAVLDDATVQAPEKKHSKRKGNGSVAIAEPPPA
jgi:hypothetical protein